MQIDGYKGFVRVNAQVTHSRIWRRISHGYDPASSVAIRISPYISLLHS